MDDGALDRIVKTNLKWKVGAYTLDDVETKVFAFGGSTDKELNVLWEVARKAMHESANLGTEEGVRKAEQIRDAMWTAQWAAKVAGSAERSEARQTERIRLGLGAERGEKVRAERSHS